MERDIFMKKAALFLTILCLVLFTVGCTSGSSTSRESYDTTGTVYSSQNTEDDDKDDEPKPMASATQTPEPDICSVCNDEDIWTVRYADIWDIPNVTCVPERDRESAPPVTVASTGFAEPATAQAVKNAFPATVPEFSAMNTR